MDVERITREIVDLHVAFERWFDGSAESLDRVEVALADGFAFVGTSGDVLTRDDVLGFLRSARGRGGVEIGIEDVEVLWRRSELVAASYIERHVHADYHTTRRATCVLESDPGAPHGLHWLSVHETWIEPPPPA